MKRSETVGTRGGSVRTEVNIKLTLETLDHSEYCTLMDIIESALETQSGVVDVEVKSEEYYE